MLEKNEESWLCLAISYLAGELSDEVKDAFVAGVKQNPEYAEKYYILKKIWKTNFEVLDEIRDTNSGWEKLKSVINREIALKYYLRKANMEKFDKKSVSMLHCIDQDLSSNNVCNIEKVVNALFMDDKPSLISPKNDLWNNIEVEISSKSSSSKRKKAISSRKKLENSRFNSRSIYITAISAAAALLLIFLILFVFIPKNTSKIAEKSDSVDEKKIPTVTVPDNGKMPDEPDKDVKENPVVDKPKDKVKDTVKHDNELDNPDDDLPKVTENKVTPKVPEKKVDEKDNNNSESKPDDVTDNKDENNTPKKDENKIKSEKPKEKPITREFVISAKYDEFDPEKINANLPQGFGVQLSFSLNPETNKFNVYDLQLPNEDGGYKVTIDGNNNLRVDSDNDGDFEKIYKKSTYKEFRLQYDEKSKKLQYRVKFIKNKNTWKILPACRMIAKKAYNDSDIILIDANLNGQYNDLNHDFYQFDEQEFQILGSVNLLGGTWCKIQPELTGQSVKVLDCDAMDTGILKFSTKYAEDVKLKWISIIGDKTSVTIKSTDIQEISDLPEGYYRIAKGIVGDKDTEVYFAGNLNYIFEVLAGKTTEITLGGDLTFKLVRSKYSSRGLEINRNNLLLYGKTGELYHTMKTKNKTYMLNVADSYLTREGDFAFKVQLSIQGLTNSKEIFVNLPYLNEPGVYMINLIEQRFSEFLTGSFTMNSTLKINKR